MRSKVILILLQLLFSLSQIIAQQSPPKMTKEEYIEHYKAVAVSEMYEYGIPASITLAQGVLESGNGNSPLALEANNHFGIKCHKEWAGETYHMDDDEQNECFRKYLTAEESYKDHSLFLTTRERYFFLFDLDITDYKSWAFGLKQAGYATNPRYPELLIKVIEDFRLYELDKQSNKSLAHHPKEERKIKKPAGLSETDDFEPISISNSDRKIFENNHVKFIRARVDDSFENIANDFQLYAFQIYKFNDLKKKDGITEGQILYIEPKKNKASTAVHLVKPGETLHGISQQYAVKLKKLCKSNSLAKDAVLYPDQKIKLR